MMTAYELPALDYDYSALEPHIDAKTMEIHHTKHHQAYLTKLLEANIDTSLPIEDVLLQYDSPAVRNNGGGFYNHCHFWKMMSPDGGGEPDGNLKGAIEADFGSFEKLKEEMKTKGMGRFGSGWVWLLKCKQDGKLRVESFANQDHPDVGNSNPIMGIDVWEHAYYLNYQNRRPDYLEAFFNVANWKYAEAQFNL